MEPNITIIIAAIPTLRLLRASRGGQHSRHQKLFSRDKIRIVRTDDSRASPMTVGAPIFKQHAHAAASTTTANSVAPPRPPRPTSNQSFWTDSSSILKGGDNNNRGLVHETSTEDLIQQSPVYSPSRDNHAPYSPGDNNNLGIPGDAGRDTLKPSTNGKRLTPLEEESSLRGSSASGGGMMMGNSNYASNFDSYYNNNNYRSSSKYSTGAFIDTYGSQAKNVVEGMELIVPLSQQRQQQPQQQSQYQYQYPQYQQYPQQQQPQSPNNIHTRQQSSHRRKPSVVEQPMYMVPVTATGGYGGML